jgi:hypothetical protein
MKTPVIYSDDYIVYIEHYQGESVIHCDCFGWSKRVKQSLLEDLDKLFQIHRKPVYAIHEIEDSKHLKFLHLTGFEYHSSFVGVDNIHRQLFVRNI